MSTRELRLTRRVPASVEEVYRAWTDPEVLARWWGPGEHRVRTAQLDVRPGGAYRIEVGTPEGGLLVMAGVYTDVQPPTRLAFTWNWEAGGPGGGETAVTVELTRVDDATEIAIVHAGFADAAEATPYTDGWAAALPKLLALFD